MDNRKLKRTVDIEHRLVQPTLFALYMELPDCPLKESIQNIIYDIRDVANVCASNEVEFNIKYKCLAPVAE